MPIGASIAATVGTGIVQASSAHQATRAAERAGEANLAFQNRVYSDATSNLQPFVSRGNTAGNALEGLLGIGGDPAAAQRAWDAYRNSTNYNFVFDQGTQAVKTANAPSFNSGATAKALINYGQGQAGSALAGYQALLAGQSTLGAQSGSALAGVGQNIAALNANANNNTAAAQGGGALATANAFGNAFAGINQAYQQQRTQSSFGGGSPSGVPGITLSGGGYDPNAPYGISGASGAL